MKKFLVLYRAPAASFEQMRQATPEQQKAGMQAWMAWGQKAHGSILDMGGPLGKGMVVTPSEAKAQPNDFGGYSILQAQSKEALVETLAGHPHFLTPHGTIEIVEVMPIPGQG
jgi:hypothetical protein